MGPTQSWSNQRLQIPGTMARMAALPGGGIGAAITNHSGLRGGNVEQKVNADGGGRRRPDDHLALARRESPSSDANAHGGRMTASNDVTNKVGGRGFPHTTINQKVEVIATLIAAETAEAANDNVGDQQRGRQQGRRRTMVWSTAEGDNVGDNVGHRRRGRGRALRPHRCIRRHSSRRVHPPAGTHPRN